MKHLAILSQYKKDVLLEEFNIRQKTHKGIYNRFMKKRLIFFDFFFYFFWGGWKEGNLRVERIKIIEARAKVEDILLRTKDILGERKIDFLLEFHKSFHPNDSFTTRFIEFDLELHFTFEKKKKKNFVSIR